MKEKLELFCSRVNARDWRWSAAVSSKVQVVVISYAGDPSRTQALCLDLGDDKNGNFIIWALDRLEELGYIAPTFGRVGDGRSLLIYEGQRLCPLQFTGSTRAEAVFNALLADLGQEEK